MDPVELFDPDNRWRDRHPAEKALLAGGMLVLAVTLVPGIVTALLFLLMTLLALVGARVSWRRFLGALAVPTGFLLAGTLSVLISIRFDNGWPTFALDSSAAGQVLLRGLAATACLVFFATTTSVPDLLALLRAAPCPAFVLELMMLTYRFSMALVQAARSIRLAQSLRRGHGSRTASFRALGMLATNLLPRALDQSRRLAVGLETRGYEGHLPVVSSARRFSWPVVSVILALQLALAGLGVVAARGGL